MDKGLEALLDLLEEGESLSPSLVKRVYEIERRHQFDDPKEALDAIREVIREVTGPEPVEEAEG